MANRSRYATYPSLKGRVVVVTGGATGIGAALVEAFALQGARVAVLDILSEAASALIQQLQTEGVEHEPRYFECDLTDVEGQLKPTASAILEEFTHVDVLVNNAGSDRRQPTLEVTPESWDLSVAVNLRHQFFLFQALLPGLLASKCASVINMGSITWAIPATGLAPYTTCKAAVVGLTKTLAHEFGPKGVRVNSIMPGAVATERQKKEILTPEYVKWVMHHQALKVELKPEDVGRMALWLAADDSSAVTNQSFVVDAGWI